MPTNPTTVDAYLATLGGEKRPALQKLRKTIKAVAPNAEECISYGIPVLRLDGKVLVGFSASANHCSFFPMNGSTVAAHKGLLVGYDTSKGTIRFQPDKPLPVALVRKLVRARIEENRSQHSSADCPTRRCELREGRQRDQA